MSPDSKELALACAQAASDIKAENVSIYDLRGTSSLTDVAVICTASSGPHLRAVLRDGDKDIDEKYGISPVYAERTPNALWSVLDYIDVMVHVMSSEIRDFYQMEQLWKDATRLEWNPQA